MKKRIFPLFFLCLLSCKNDSLTPIEDSNKVVELKDTFIPSNRNSWEDYYATNVFQEIPNDSIRLRTLAKLSLHFIEKDSLTFRKINKEAMSLSQSLQEWQVLANSYWDLAFFFSNQEILDSAYVNYYKAYKLYNKEGERKYAGRMLLNMAILQEKVKDYIGSEISTIRALEIIPERDKYQLYRVNNNLAVVYNGMENYSEALAYHNIAKSIAEDIDDSGLVA